jgi:hypothetical protein
MSATCTIEKSRENEMRIIFFGNIKLMGERERENENNMKSVSDVYVHGLCIYTFLFSVNLTRKRRNVSKVKGANWISIEVLIG